MTLDLIHEIKHDVTKDRLLLWVKRYAYYLIGSVSLLLSITAYIIWHNHKADLTNQYYGNKFYQAIQLLEQGKTKSAKELFIAIFEAPSAQYKSLAGFELAALYIAESHIDQAITIYDQLIKHPNTNFVFKEFAKLLGSYTRMEYDRDDQLQPTLDEISEKGQPFYYLALELQAIDAMKQRNYTQAEKFFSILATDLHTPSTIRTRAHQMLDVIKHKLHGTA